MNELPKPKRVGEHRGRHPITPEERRFLCGVAHAGSDMDLVADRACFFGSEDPNAALLASDERKDSFVVFHAQRNELRRNGGDPTTINP